MAITAPRRLRPGAGQNPAYTPSGAGSTVDALADQIGISAVSGGQPCGSPNSLLRLKADCVALPIVWSTRSLSRPWPRDREWSGGYARRHATLT